MALAHINLSTKQYFNFMCKTEFERRIYHDSYKEFQKKSRIFNLDERLNTFSSMVNANPEAASLHQKLNYAVVDSVESLEHKTPVLHTTDGKSIRFDWAEFHICESDLTNKAAHIVSLTYTSSKLVLHEMVGNFLILSYESASDPTETFMVKLNDEIAINYEKRAALVY